MMFDFLSIGSSGFQAGLIPFFPLELQVVFVRQLQPVAKQMCLLPLHILLRMRERTHH